MRQSMMITFSVSFPSCFMSLIILSQLSWNLEGKWSRMLQLKGSHTQKKILLAGERFTVWCFSINELFSIRYLCYTFYFLIFATYDEDFSELYTLALHSPYKWFSYSKLFLQTKHSIDLLSWLHFFRFYSITLQFGLILP